ncbi:20557_t:CDS:1, partial [Dentiscutata erythropus]
SKEFKKPYQQSKKKSSIVKSCDINISCLTDKKNINLKKMTTDSLEKK